MLDQPLNTTDHTTRKAGWAVLMTVLVLALAALGVMPTAVAMLTGAAAQIGHVFTAGLASAGPLALIAGLYLFSVLVTQLVGGQVAVLIVGPIAVSAAVSLGVNPTAVGVAVAMACSAAFLTPIAHPVNVLMMGPGGYHSIYSFAYPAAVNVAFQSC